MKPAIRAQQLGKRYRLGRRQQTHDTLGGAALAALGAPLRQWRDLRRLSTFSGAAAEPDVLWALRDVSFEVAPGEILGIIGRNGAGKSTLLKLLNRVTDPSEGVACVRGRMASLLEVGTGFHPDLTGRENVYLNGAMLGMRRATITRRFDEIVAFSGIEPFIDTPVKRYSSGMAVRLGFAVGAHLDADILLVDEVLAVGDAGFRQQCLGKMQAVAGSGRTVLLVSHSMAAITGLSQRVLMLEAGRIVAEGAPHAVVEQYLTQVRGLAQATALEARTDRTGSGELRITAVRTGTGATPDAGFWITGQEALLDIAYAAPGGALDRVDIAVGVRSLMDVPLLYLATRLTNQVMNEVRGTGGFRCRIPKLGLDAGRYLLNIEVRHGGVKVDHVQSAAEVEVHEGDYFGSGVISTYGGVVCDHRWERLDPAGSGPRTERP